MNISTTIYVGKKRTRVDLKRLATVLLGAACIFLMVWFFASMLNVVVTNDNPETSGQLANWNFFKIMILNRI